MRPKTIAFHLPQFYEMPENNLWWGHGHTEWSTLKKSKKYLDKQIHPNIPKGNNYYDLSSIDANLAQASLASENGIDAFCYYHYWFGNGRVIMDKAIKEVNSSKKWDFPFLLCWANQSWNRSWFENSKELLIAQEYPGTQDIIAHLKYLKPFFDNENYYKENGQPVLIIHDILPFDGFQEYLEKYKIIAIEELGTDIKIIGGYLQREKYLQSIKWESDRIIEAKIGNSFSEAFEKENLKFLNRLKKTIGLSSNPMYYAFEAYAENVIRHYEDNPSSIPMIVPNWDDTPRLGNRGHILGKWDSTQLANIIIQAVKTTNNHDYPKIFIKSWNEWSEGNYLEPDERFGSDLLDIFKSTLAKY